jgi:hypothetical protein
MIKHILSFIKCKAKGHTFTPAGSCPFTGKTYNGCTICGKMITV